MDIGLGIHGIVMVAVAGVGHHLEAVLMFHPHQVVAWAKSIYSLEMIYLPAVALPKISILSLYLRIFPNRVFRGMTMVIVAIVLLNWLAFALASTFQCSPVTYQWDKSIEGGRCFDVLLFYRMVNVPNVVTDIAMLILPMPMVWKLHTSRPRRIGLTGSRNNDVDYETDSTGSIKVRIKPLPPTTAIPTQLIAANKSISAQNLKVLHDYIYFRIDTPPSAMSARDRLTDSLYDVET
ncbi:MAG: hypothetical protein LQ344_006600 [Seirophora lacunosa]|nr:MAG: hypothetical protein LQ344_006600 [Seirophora lacunosa]